MTLNVHIQRIMAASVIVGTFGLAAWGGSAIASAAPRDDSSYDYSQSAFPCEEDEVLGYAPQFGPDRVGCIHIDDLRNDSLEVVTSGWWIGNLIYVD